MPDLMSHLLIALIIGEIFNIRKKSLLALGALMPDMLSKGHLVYLHLGITPNISFVLMHTPVMVLLLSILIAPLFLYNRLKTILLINSGALTHFLSDLTMRHFTVIGTRIFFPFSMANYTLNWIWPEDSIYVLIAGLLVYAGIRFIKKRYVQKSRKAKAKPEIYGAKHENRK